MSEIVELFKAANGLTPLAIMGLLAAAILLLAKGRKEVSEKMDTLANNHLHELPLLVENSTRSVDILQRIDTKLAENFAVIHVKLDNLDEK